MAVPNILILAARTPGAAGIQGAILRDLCEAYPHEHQSCFVVPWHQGQYSDLPEDLSWLPLESAPNPFGRSSGRFLRRIPAIGGPTSLSMGRYFRLPQTVRRIAEFGRRHRVDTVWAMLSLPHIALLARGVAKALNADLLTTVWDAPEIKMQLYDRFSNGIVMREFGRVLRESKRTAVISQQMADDYGRRYDAKPVILRHGIRPEILQQPETTLNDDDSLVIGYAGSLYAKHEWLGLLEALSSREWKLAGRAVRIRFLGAEFPFPHHMRVHIEYHGWCSVDETTRLMVTTDLTYLPYEFDEDRRVFATTSFPSKLTTYLAAGRPVFFHGPRYSTISSFYEQYPIGPRCHSLNADDIIESLEDFLTEEGRYRSAVEAGQRAIDQELSDQVFRRRFADFMGVSEKNLVPELRATASHEEAGINGMHQ